MTVLSTELRATIAANMTALAQDLASAIRAGDGETAAAALAMEAMETVAAIMRDAWSSGYAVIYGLEEANALFSAALEAQRLSTARTAKAISAWQMAAATYHTAALATVVV